MNDLFEALQVQNPYPNLPLDDHPHDMQGWNSNHPNFHTMVKTYAPSLIVEVGSWKGGSACTMAGAARQLGLDCKIICVDTWLGSVEHRRHQEYKDSLREKHGYPQLFHTFACNIKRQGFADMIFPFPNSSNIAAQWMKERGIEPDIVFIDGSHDTEAVYNDAADWFNLVKVGGAIFGDDFSYPTVEAGLRLFCDKNRLKLEPLDHVQWIIRKGSSQSAKRLIELV